MSGPRRRRTDASRAAPRPTKAERKRQLLAVAKQLFLTLGYRPTTTEAVAAAAGVSDAVFARHFASKQALFEEVLQELRAATVARWQAETAALPDPPAKLHAVADLYLAASREHALEFRVVHRALVESAEDEELRALLRDFFLESETFLAGIIAEGQQSGVFRRSLDPRVGAWEMIRSGMGYTLTEPLGVPLYGENDYTQRAVDCLLHCLLKTDV
jgi:AcrR family transcriptional regulator